MVLQWKRINEFLYSYEGRYKFRCFLVSSFAGVAFCKSMKVTLFSGWFSNKLEDIEEASTSNLINVIQKERCAFVQENAKLKFDVFFSKKLDPSCIGTSALRVTKGRIGLPLYFKYDTAEQIERALSEGELTLGKWKLKFDDKNADLKKQLAQSLYLSDSAKRFVIHSELLTASYKYIPHFIDLGLFTAFGIVGSCVTLSANYNKWFSLIRRGFRIPRYCMYIMTWTLCFWAYQESYLYFTKKFYYDLDNEIAMKDRSYLAGALQFYKQTLQRNKLLMEILPENKWSGMFTKHGNLMDELPVTNRLRRIRQLHRDRVDLE